MNTKYIIAFIFVLALFVNTAPALALMPPDSLDPSRAAKIQELNDHWREQDIAKDVEREKLKNADELFAKLETALADAPDSHKQALEVFRVSLRAASNERQLAVDTAVNAFRSGVRGALQSRPGDVRTLVEQYRASIRSATVDFKTDVLEATTQFKKNLMESQ